MNRDSVVVFKGRKDGILVALDADCGFDELKEAMSRKAAEASEFFGDARIALSFSGRELSEKEELELVDALQGATGVSVSFVTPRGDTVEKNARPARGRAAASSRRTAKLSPDESVTLYHRGSLRSGQSLSYVGSVTLLGDLNPGAEIIAEGNIIILGHAKGLVHAGCSGNRACYVYSLDMRPTQLRIADMIAFADFGEAGAKARQKTALKPEIAYISGEEITIDEAPGR